VVRSSARTPDAPRSAVPSNFEEAQRRAAAFKSKVTSTPEPARETPDTLNADHAVKFPSDVLPQELKTWALAAAEFNQTPVSLSCAFALMSAMTASVHMNVQIRDGWVEPAVSQMMLIASPSERKSPVFGAAFAPVYEWSKREKKRQAAQRQTIQNEIDTILVDNKGEAKPSKSGSPEAKRLADLKARLAAVPQPRRRIADDITPEEFMRQMHENDGTMCLVSDEADVFQSFGGRYSQGEAKLAPLLKGWDGKTPLMYDRVGGGGGKQRINIVIEEPRAGIAIAGQYTVLEVLTRNPVYRAKGMLARMLYIVLPERTRERKMFPEGIARSIHQQYNDAILRQFDLDNEAPLLLKNRKDFGNGWNIPQWLQNLRQRIETGVLSDGEFASIPDWAGKLVSNMARVAAVIESMGGGGEENLAALCDFFIVHAKRALAQPGSAAPARGTVLDELSYVVAQLGKKFPTGLAVAGQTGTTISKPFTIRDAKRACNRMANRTTEEFEKLINELIVKCHLEEVPNDDAVKLGNRAIARKLVLVSRINQEPVTPPEDDMPNGQPAQPPIPDEEFFGRETRDNVSKLINAADVDEYFGRFDNELDPADEFDRGL
jgi:hypothetical protein